MEEFQQSGWLKELIIMKRFNDSVSPKNSDILEMLTCSQPFFEFIFSPSFTIKQLVSIDGMFNTCPIVRYDHCGKIVAAEQSENVHSMVYNLFLFFAFIDYWHDKQTGRDNNPLRECVDKIRRKSFEINKHVLDFNSSLEYMQAILSFEENLRTGKDSDELERALQYYKHDLDFYSRTKQKDDNARRKVDIHYDKIATILKLGVKRRV
jgi:hypothetical protein